MELKFKISMGVKSHCLRASTLLRPSPQTCPHTLGPMSSQFICAQKNYLLFMMIVSNVFIPPYRCSAGAESSDIANVERTKQFSTPLVMLFQRQSYPRPSFFMLFETVWSTLAPQLFTPPAGQRVGGDLLPATIGSK